MNKKRHASKKHVFLPDGAPALISATCWFESTQWWDPRRRSSAVLKLPPGTEQSAPLWHPAFLASQSQKALASASHPQPQLELALHTVSLKSGRDEAVGAQGGPCACRAHPLIQRASAAACHSFSSCLCHQANRQQCNGFIAEEGDTHWKQCGRSGSSRRCGSWSSFLQVCSQEKALLAGSDQQL
jgi:hypothetical protein